MHENTRACVAYVALKPSGFSLNAVYDYLKSKYISIDGTVTETKVNIYDYDRSCYFGGDGKSLYDYGLSSYVDFELKGKSFEGYDYKSSNYFSGTISGSNVSLYDYATSKYYEFSK